MTSYEERLAEYAEMRMSELGRIEQNYEDMHGRDREIAKHSEFSVMDFWCRKCRKERTGLGEKVVVTWNGEKSAWYQSWGLCHRLRRHITDKLDDPYWKESPKLKKERATYFKDMLQPGQEGFDLLYSNKINA